MREIIFRGRTADTKEWVYGGYAEIGNTPFIISTDEQGTILWYEVELESVGQFTGLLDDNGKRVFEGDVLKFSYTGKNRGVSGKVVVSFRCGKFGVEWGWNKDFVSLDGFANTTMKVVRNLHDNPELMEGDKN